jgi:His-Xaa-Ser system protein HxsD
MVYQNRIHENAIIVYADASLYTKDAIFKCMYWYTDKFHISISLRDNKTYEISIHSPSTRKYTESELEEILLKLERDLIDFNLRDIVTKETSNIRDLIIAKAFSNGEFDETPPGEISDPIGFNINNIHDE